MLEGSINPFFGLLEIWGIILELLPGVARLTIYCFTDMVSRGT